jgi:hypothetical protein
VDSIVKLMRNNMVKGRVGQVRFFRYKKLTVFKFL